MQALVMSGFRFLFVVGVMFIFLGSNSFLFLLGLNLTDENASLFQRLHPSFYLCLPLILVLILSLFQNGFKIKIPRFVISNELKILPWKSFFFYSFAVILSIICILLGVSHASLMNTATTFLLPVICILGLTMIRSSQLVFLRNFIICLFIFNSIIGIIENFFDFRLFPYIVNNVEATKDNRPTAWFSHPLNNALLTLLILTYFLYSKKNENKALVKNFSILICGLALPCFGGRTALVVIVIFLLINYLKTLSLFVLIGRKYKSLLIQTVGILSGFFVVLYLNQFGLFDNVIERFKDDGGSADVRWGAFDLIADLEFSKILFGVSDEWLMTVLHNYQLFTIEFSWLYLILKHGLLIAIILILSLFLMLYRISKVYGKPVNYMCFGFFIITFGYTSIASANLVLAQLLIMIFLLKKTGLKGV